MSEGCGAAKDNWQTTGWQLSQAKQQAIPAHDEHR